MVVIVHPFDGDVSAHVVESWLDFYLPYAALKTLLVPRHQQNQRWTLLRRLLPRRVLAVLHGLSPSPSQQRGPTQQERAPESTFFGPASSPPRKEAHGEGNGPSPSSAASRPPMASGTGDTLGSPSRAMRFAAAAAKSALALATPGPAGAASSAVHGAGATTTPSTGRLSPSPSVGSVCSAMDGPTMADLGRADSLDRFGSIGGGGGVLDLGELGQLMQGGSPEAREVLVQ